MKYYKNNELENMMLNIVDFGKEEVWKDIEIERDARVRCHKRKVYAQALKRIEQK